MSRGTGNGELHYSVEADGPEMTEIASGGVTPALRSLFRPTNRKPVSALPYMTALRAVAGSSPTTQSNPAGVRCGNNVTAPPIWCDESRICQTMRISTSPTESSCAKQSGDEVHRVIQQSVDHIEAETLVVCMERGDVPGSAFQRSGRFAGMAVTLGSEKVERSPNSYGSNPSGSMS